MSGSGAIHLAGKRPPNVHAARRFTLIELDVRIRATYTPRRKFKLNPEFLAILKKNEPEKPITSKPQVFLVALSTFVPRLTPSELEKIDNMVAQDNMRQEKRQEPSVRDKVLGARDDRPTFSKDLKPSQPRTCSYCKTVGDRDLNRCSRCKLLFHYSRDCEVFLWVMFIVLALMKGSAIVKRRRGRGIRFSVRYLSERSSRIFHGHPSCSVCIISPHQNYSQCIRLCSRMAEELKRSQ